MINLTFWLFRSLHILAAATWVGGSLLYLIVVVPMLKLQKLNPEAASTLRRRHHLLTQICIAVLLLSGGLLLFERLSYSALTGLYIWVLVTKVVLALSMFLLALLVGRAQIRRLAKQPVGIAPRVPYILFVLGILVFLLGAALNLLFEQAYLPQ